MTSTASVYSIIFDGGSIGNPGRGYGSYAVRSDGESKWTVTRLDYPGRVTNNEAEYDTLIAALENLAESIRRSGGDPAQATLQVRGDSQLVIYQVIGRWKVREPRMQVRCTRVQALAKAFKRVTFTQHPRAESVKVLGH